MSIVLQVLAPHSDRVRVEDRPWSESYAYGFRQDEPVELALAAYNFGKERVKGQIELEHLPGGWQLSLGARRLELDVMGRTVLPLTFSVGGNTTGEPARDGWVVVRGDFGLAGRPALAFRMLAK